MKNPGNNGFGGPEYQPPPPYSPSHEFNNPPYSPFYAQLPTTPSVGAPSLTVPISSGNGNFAVTIPPNAPTVTVMSYDPPQQRCRCIHGILLVLFMIAAIVVLARFLEYSTQTDDFSEAVDSRRHWHSQHN